MLINHTSPKCPEVYTVNNPCSCYIDTCSKKLIQSELLFKSKRCLAPHEKIVNFGCGHAGLFTIEKQGASTIIWLSVFLSFTTRKLTTKSGLICLPGMLKPANEVNYYVKVLLSSVRFDVWHLYSGQSNLKLSYFVVECFRFEVNLFFVKGEIGREM